MVDEGCAWAAGLPDRSGGLERVLQRSEVDMGTKDKGGSKASKKPAQKSIKEKRQAKASKKGR
jgi:hypothetical protein